MCGSEGQCGERADLVLVEVGDYWIVFLPVLGLHELQNAMEALPVLNEVANNLDPIGIHNIYRTTNSTYIRCSIHPIWCL